MAGLGIMTVTLDDVVSSIKDIARLSLKPHDVLVIRLNCRATTEQMARIRDVMQGALRQQDLQNSVVVLDEAVDFEVVGHETPEANWEDR